MDIGSLFAPVHMLDPGYICLYQGQNQLFPSKQTLPVTKEPWLVAMKIMVDYPGVLLFDIVELGRILEVEFLITSILDVSLVPRQCFCVISI